MFELRGWLIAVGALVALWAAIGGFAAALGWLLQFRPCLIAFLASIPLLGILWLVGARRDRARGWRTSLGRGDILTYDEIVDGQWRVARFAAESDRSEITITLDGAAWAAQPEWARARRDEITRRIRQAYPHAWITS